MCFVLGLSFVLINLLVSVALIVYFHCCLCELGSVTQADQIAAGREPTKGGLTFLHLSFSFEPMFTKLKADGG